MEKTIPVSEGDIIEIETTDLSVDGAGIGRYEGFAVFSEGLLPGERARVEITRVTKKYAAAKTLERTQDSPMRRVPPCILAESCGGCTLQHLQYMGQLQVKDERIRHELAKAAKNAQINYPLPSPIEFRYRNKTAFPVQQGEGGVKVGCYKKGTHVVVDTARCLLQTPAADRCVNAVSRWMSENGIAPYDETTHTGLVRHVLVRCTCFDEVMVGIVTNGDKLPAEKALVREVRRSAPQVMSIVQNINDRPGNVILGDRTRTVFGEDTIRERICGLDFDISLTSFLQVNHGGTELLYTTVEKLARLLPQETAVDLYCGAGTISLLLAQHCKKIYGIEIVESAVENAKSNAALNGVENAEFLCADSAEGFSQVLAREPKIDLVVVDPPRKGLSKEVIGHIAKAVPGRVVYVSCDPATLARDLVLLSEKGYEASFVQPVDMFPQTTHVDTVVLLSRKSEE